MAFIISFPPANYHWSSPICGRSRPSRDRPSRSRSAKRSALYDAMSAYAAHFTAALDAEFSAEQADAVTPKTRNCTLIQKGRLYSSMVYSIHPPRRFRQAELIAVSDGTATALATALPDGCIAAPIGSAASQALSEIAASAAYISVVPAVNSLPYERAIAALESLTKQRPSAGEIARMIVSSFIDTPEINTRDPVQFRTEPGGPWFDLARETVAKVSQERLNRVVKQLPLNPSQGGAIRRALRARLTLIQGPPGTGKTFTAAHLISACVSLGTGPVLACASSNVATDNLLRKVRETTANANIVRVGRVSAVAEDLWKTTLDYLLERNARVRNARDALERGKIRVGELIDLEQRVATGILRSADIVIATCVSCGREELKGLKFPVVLVDEATQATEPDVLIPLMATDKMATQVILVGDHHQLPPTVLSHGPGERLAVSMFLRLWSCRVGCELLSLQYRMHPQIAKFPAKRFYFGGLQDGVSLRERMLPESYQKVALPALRKARVLFCDVSSGREENEASRGDDRKRGTSFLNKGEVAAVASIVRTLRRIPERFKGADVGKGLNVGIISPYAAQVRLLRETLDAIDNRIEVNTVDAYQGREKDIIILSTVRSNPLAKMGFLQDWRRLNVALTRARYVLIVVGHRSTVMGNPHWASWIAFVKSQGGLFNAKDLTDEDFRNS